MERFSQIPPNLFQYGNKSAYFITYFGDIYFGSLWECPGYRDGFFIVQNDKMHDIQQAKTVEQFRLHGREIKDHRIIKEVITDQKHFSNNMSHSRGFRGQTFEKMFVFGAAASSYCVFGDLANEFRKAPYNPPTGYEIFNEKYDPFFKNYPALRQSIPEFEAKQNDIEECLESEWTLYKDSYSPDVVSRHLNIQFYLQELFQNISDQTVSKAYRKNLYSLFCKRLQQSLKNDPSRKSVIVSFNYDTILDQFLESLTSPFKHIEDYTNWDERSIVFFKPHGSCNWGWALRDDEVGNLTRAQVVQQLFEKKIEPWQLYYNLIGPVSKTVDVTSWGPETGHHKEKKGRLTLNKNLIEILPRNTRKTHFPALLLPYRDKDEFVMPYHQQQDLRNCMAQVEEVYLIGWKANEDLFNRTLKNNSNRLKRIIIVNPDNKSVISNLTKASIDLSQYKVSSVNNFEEFVLNFN